VTTPPTPTGGLPDTHVPAEALFTEFEGPDVLPPELDDGKAIRQGKELKRGQFRDIWRRYKKNKLALVGLGIIAGLLLIAIFEPILTPYDPYEQNLANTRQQPDSEHWFGTDTLGRDLFSGILFGTRLAMIVGVSVVLLSLLVGVTAGAIAGYRGKGIDSLIMRTTDIFLAFPYLIGAILVVRIVGDSVTGVILALAVLAWPTSARLMRGQVLALRESEYVEAARSVGASDTRIVIRHILPNAIAPVLIYAFTAIGVSVVAMASLAFLGVGVPADTPEWGRLITNALPYLRQDGMSYMWLSPSLAIVITTLGFAFVADGLRDSLDPKLR
jgi:peptide/nickel transport system permease protein